MGTIIVGDTNTHHRRWLRYSARNSAEGEALKTFCDNQGLQQMVKERTQSDYLLDLLLTDVDGVRCKVLPKIADHKLLL